jgi:inner membrane protein
MASIGHVAVGMAASRVYGRPRWTSMALWSALSLLPDIDVVGFVRGVPYGAPWGHRGATHSLTLAIVGGIVTGVAARWIQRPLARTMLFACVVLVSHGLLDSMTDGGLGIALLWPFSLTRFFAPWRPITVAPIGADFFTVYGATVAASEVVLFAPLLLFALWPRARSLPRVATVGLAFAWLGGVWLMASGDPVRERVIGAVVRDNTLYADGYSEDAFRRIYVGEAEGDVRGRLGEPLAESWYFMPPGLPYQSAMEVGAAQLPRGCLGVRLKAGVVEEALFRDLCLNRGVGEGSSRDEVRRSLGEPSESCAEYSHRGGSEHFRLRMVCFLRGKVEVVFRRWM